MKPLFDPESLRRVASLELLARQVVEGALTGLHRSPFHGYSVDFLQHRPYAAGDDLRRLDWKVFGKTDRHYVRQYEDETNLRATIVVDTSASMAYGSAAVSKLHYALRLAAAMAYLLALQQDAVGLALVDAAARVFVPPESGQRQLRRIIDELERAESGGATDLGAALQGVQPRLPPRGLVIIISDALDDPVRTIDAVAKLRAAHHEVIVLQVLDRQEIEFRFGSWTRFECLEDADRKLLADGAQVRRAYLDALERLLASLREGCRRVRADYALMPSDVAYDAALSAFLRAREGRA